MLFIIDLSSALKWFYDILYFNQRKFQIRHETIFDDVCLLKWYDYHKIKYTHRMTKCHTSMWQWENKSTLNQYCFVMYYLLSKFNSIPAIGMCNGMLTFCGNFIFYCNQRQLSSLYFISFLFVGRHMICNKIHINLCKTNGTEYT